MFYESLESRRLFSVTLDTGGNLVQTGTSGNDVVSVKTTKVWPGGVIKLVVTENGVTSHFSPSHVRHIYLRGVGGNDQLSIAKNIYTPATVYGGDGDDVLTGGAGGDTISGGAGNDTVDGGLGADSLHGGTGRDIVTYASRTNSVYIRLDGVRNDGETGENDLISSDFEEHRGGQGRDYLYGNELINYLDGGAGNDYIRGYGGNDNLLGGPGTDIIYGNAGNDFIIGDGGNDFLYGDAGNDDMWGGWGNDEMLGGDGDDKMNGSSTDYESGARYRSYADFYSPDPVTDDDFVVGQAGRDGIMDVTGSNYLYGGAGNDWFLTDYLRYSGAGGSSYIDGGDGYDIAAYFDYDTRVNVESDSRSFDEDAFFG